MKKQFVVIPPEKKREPLQQQLDTIPVLKLSANTQHTKERLTGAKVKKLCLCSTFHTKEMQLCVTSCKDFLSDFDVQAVEHAPLY